MANRSPRGKESSFLKKIGEELAGFGLTSRPAARKPAEPSSESGTPTGQRRSHRPAPRVPGAKEEAFPGVKLRSRETLMPPADEPDKKSEDAGELNDDDFKDLAVLLDNDVASVVEPSQGPELDDSNSSIVDAPPQLNAPPVPTRSRAELEKDLNRFSLSDAVPEEEAPLPPQLKSPRSTAPVPPVADASKSDERVAVLKAEAAKSAAAASEASAKASALKSENERLQRALDSIKSDLERSTLKEKEIAGKLSQRDREHRIAEAETKQRVQELEIQLDALKRAQDAKNEKKSEEPTREELMAAMDAYRKKLAEMDAAGAAAEEAMEELRRQYEEKEVALKKSDERKTQLRDDLRNLIAKSKEIEKNAKQWKERCESYEAKFAKTKSLAREFSERCKQLEKEKKLAADKGNNSDEVEELKLKVAKLEQRCQKAEEMAKVSVGVIKRSGNTELKKEMSLALQSIQHQAKTSASAVEVKAERRKSPRLEEGKKMARSDSSPPPSLAKKSPRLEVTPPPSNISPSSSSPPSSPPPSSSPDKRSPRLNVIRSTSEKGFLSPQVERKKNTFVTASAGGSKTPTVPRHKSSSLLDVSKTPTVSASPQMRKKNPGRSANPSPAVVRKREAPKKVLARDEDSAFDLLSELLTTEEEAPQQNPFDMLEDVLTGVEKETGAKMTGDVDTSDVFAAGSSDPAGDYLAAMRGKAQAQSAELEAKRREQIQADKAKKAAEERAAMVQRQTQHREMLSRFLAEEQAYMEAMLNDPTNALHALLPILSKEKVLTEEETFALLDGAQDTDYVGSEFVVRVELFDARDLSDPDADAIFGVVSVKSDLQTTSSKPLSPLVQWNETFLFSDISASSRVTITIMSKQTRLGVAQINLSELAGCSKEYYPIVDNSSGQDSSVIRGMLTAKVSLHTRTVRKEPLVVKLDPNSQNYQDAVRHGVAKLKRCEENRPREREFDASLTLSPVHVEMDKPKPNLQWIAQQLRSGAIKGDDGFENVYRRTILHLMCIAGDVQSVEMCLAAGADPKKRDIYGMLPFHLAIVWGHLKLLQNLLPVMRAFGQSVHTPENVSGLPPVHLAAVFNRPQILSVLLSMGADADDKDDFGGLPIHKAAFVGSLPCLKILLEHRAFVKAEDTDGNTPLLLAMMEGHWDVTDYLLTNNVSRASWDTVNLAGESALWFAVQRANKRFTKMFLESRESNAGTVLREPHGPYEWSILMRALNELDHAEGEDVIRMLVDSLVERGIGLNQRSKDGKTAAFVATFRGNDKALAWMATRGLDLLVEDDNGNSCLHFASTLSVVEVLLEAGASVNLKNRQGNTPLHSAYAFHPEIVDMLISHGANPKTKNGQGRRPIECVGLPQSRICMPFRAEDLAHRGTCGVFLP